MVFDVVPREVGPNAIALSNLAMNVMRTGGPSLGAGLIVVTDPHDPRLGRPVQSLPGYPEVGGPWVVQPLVAGHRP